MQFLKVEYNELSAKQKEIFNFQKVAAILADYGFNCIKLADDWQGADFLAYHKDEDETLKVQLKARPGVDKKYAGKGLWMCFPIAGSWYLIPHDRLVEIVAERTNWLNTRSWRDNHRYTSANPSRRMIDGIASFKL